MVDARSLLQEWDWRNGILLLFAPRRETIPYQQQVDLLTAHAGSLADRDIVVIEAIGDRAVSLGGGLGETLETARLRDAFNVAEDDFCMIYVGKDGLEKLRWEEPVAVERLFRLIDAADPPTARQPQGDSRA